MKKIKKHIIEEDMENVEKKLIQKFKKIRHQTRL